MDEQTRAAKQARYDELCANEERNDDAEMTEQVQLFYELHPEHQHWLSATDRRTPQQIWHAYPEKGEQQG